MLIPSDTHRKFIASITAVLLPFVTHLLSLPKLGAEYGPPEEEMKNPYPRQVLKSIATSFTDSYTGPVAMTGIYCRMYPGNATSN
jgi:hypothetical protein